MVLRICSRFGEVDGWRMMWCLWWGARGSDRRVPREMLGGLRRGAACNSTKFWGNEREGLTLISAHGRALDELQEPLTHDVRSRGARSRCSFSCWPTPG
eukprot:6227957-Prymnesium_polylepis.1